MKRWNTQKESNDPGATASHYGMSDMSLIAQGYNYLQRIALFLKKEEETKRISRCVSD